MPHILRCDHHHVCWMLRFRNKCKNDGQPKPVCMFDTRLHSNASERETVLDDYNDELLTRLVQELAGTWRMRDAKLFSIIRKYRRVPIGAMNKLRKQEQP